MVYCASGTNPAIATSFKYVGILDSTNLEEWRKDRDSKKYKEEFFPQWFSKWVADFYVLAGVEVYHGESD